GYMTRRLTYAGYSVERSRKLVLWGTALLCLLSVPAARAMTPWFTLPLLFVVGAAAMGGLPLFFALSQEVSPRHTALCLGLCGSAAWVVIAVLQPPIGALVDRVGTFVPSLIVIGFVPLLGALVGLLWPEPERGLVLLLPAARCARHWGRRGPRGGFVGSWPSRSGPFIVRDTPEASDRAVESVLWSQA